MTILAETLITYALILEATGLPWINFECGPWINNDKGKLTNIERLPKKKGIYIHYFVVEGQWICFYAGMTRAKDGVYGRISIEYNKKSQAGPAKSGPYQTCLYLDYEGFGGLPIGILFHDMSDKSDHEIEQAEKELLKKVDFCANQQNNGSRRLDDLLNVIVKLNKTAKPYLNTIEIMETPKEVEKMEVEDMVEEEVDDTPSPDLCRSMIPSYAEILHPDLFRKLREQALETYHKLLYQSCKEMLSDRENQRILEEARG
jgi:hypothetical protein